MKYEIKIENSEEDNNEYVLQKQWKMNINFLSICWEMYVEAKWDSSYDTLMQEKIQPQMGNLCKHEDELDIEINELL